MEAPRQRVPEWLVTATSWTWRLLLLALAAALLAWVAGVLYLVTLPLLGAVILATLATPPARWLRARGVPDGVAAAIVVLGGLAALGGLFTLIAPQFVDQITELGPTILQGWEELLEWLEDLGYDRAQLAELAEQAGQRAQASGGRIVSGLATGAVVVVEVITGLALMIVLLFFFVKDGEEIVGWFQARTAPRHRDTVRGAGARAWTALSGYVRGTAIIAAIDATAIGIGLAVLEVPLVLPLSVLVFLGAFLPVIGAFIAGLVAVLIALASGGLTTALWTLALIVVVQQVEGQLLQPTIMRRTVALHPVVILVALTAGAAVAGIAGAFLSVPLAAVLAAVGNELRLRAEAGPGTSRS